LTLTAGPIVVLIARLFNRHRLNVGVGPLVNLMPVECDALFADGKLADVRPDRSVEFGPAHPQIPAHIARPDEPGRDG
jgi:hypothetical protein